MLLWRILVNLLMSESPFFCPKPHAPSFFCLHHTACGILVPWTRDGIRSSTKQMYCEWLSLGSPLFCLFFLFVIDGFNTSLGNKKKKVILPVYSIRKLFKSVASHIKPLKGRHVQHSRRDCSKEVHTQIKVSKL